MQALGTGNAEAGSARSRAVPVSWFAAPDATDAPNHFDAAIRLLFPSVANRYKRVRYQGRNATLATLFPKAAFETIRSWRKGHRKPPEYARDILAARLDLLSQQAAEIAKALREQK